MNTPIQSPDKHVGDNMFKINLHASSLLQAMRISGCSALAVIAIFAAIPADACAAAIQKTFATPEQAGEALAAAWNRGSKANLLKIFGPSGAKLVSSGDDIADKEAEERLATEYGTLHRIEMVGGQKATLVIGKEEFPFPIPIVKEANVWRFDTRAGTEEILNRRVGRNELNAIEVCRAYVESQREYASADRLGNGLHEYAQKIASDRDKHNGLYWRAAQSEEESPLGPLVASAASEGYSAARSNMLSPYHGYYYKILTRQGDSAPGGASDYIVNGHMTGGFGLVAFPAKYGDSGIMTFVVNHDGIVFEKNLGPYTTRLAQQMTAYNPDQTWKTP